MNCEKAKELLPLALYGELSFEEEEQFEAHLAGCDACQQAMVQQADLHHLLDEQEEMPSAVLLQQCRQDLKNELSLRQPIPVPSATWWQRLSFTNPFAMLAKPAAALALVMLGFGLARFTGPESPANTNMASFGNSAEPIAVKVRDVEPVEAGQIQIVIEESRERKLSGKLNDDRIRQLLLTAAREAADPGLRVESMDILKTQPESQEIRRALVTSLQHDDNPGVRLKALEGLRPFALDPDVQRALTEVLLNDSNAGVRTQAIDLLIQNKEASMAGVFQELMHRENNLYVRQRCQKALQEMHASTESF